ncbi:MAG: glutathione binding-like protein [Gammaproteobacteria bacterium]|nr:glutathione binding-like protein [Gammaproteobacteria bacterium]
MKRNSMTLYVGTDINSQRLHITLAEKAITADIIQVNENNVDPGLLEISPDGQLPLLIDRDLVLDIASVMTEYLDERFPHPPLLPVYPVARAKSRLLIGKIEQTWFPLMETLLEEKTDEKINELMNQILQLTPLLEDNTFFLSSELSLVDCAVAPILWRLQQMGVDFSNYSKLLQAYADNVFARDSFQASLSEQEVYSELTDDI